MSASHAARQKPTPLLAIVALVIVHRYKPDWCALTLTEAATAGDVRLDFLSHLATRALGPFEAIIARLTQRGRPKSEASGPSADQEVKIARALLDVTTSILKMVTPNQRRRCRDLIVGAWERLRSEFPGLTQAAYAAVVGVPERTLRAWLKAPRAAPPPPKEERPRPPKPKRTLKRPRFQFDLALPGVQFGADTTNLKAFGFDLKMIGVQDIGGRDRSLFDSVVIDTHESRELVIEAMKKALTDHAGAQALTDQGTPYMAEATKQALDKLEVEHAPQKEGDPTGKSTVERGFRTIKSIAEPLLRLTNDLAQAIPGLRCEALAKGATTLLMASLLRAYQAGGRAARRAVANLGQLSEEQLLAVADRAREAARATDRSRRLLLAHIHELYEIPGSAQDFIGRFRRYPIQVLHDAERAFRRAVQRGNIRKPIAYFATIVRDQYATHRRAQVREQRSDDTFARLSQACAQAQGEQARAQQAPVNGLRRGLEMLALQWLPSRQCLLGGGAGLGSLRVKEAVMTLVSQFGPIAARDVAASVFRDFATTQASTLGELGLKAVHAILEQTLGKATTDSTEVAFAPPEPSNTLRTAGTNGHPRPRSQLPI